jgi:hypothetical protein
MVPLPAGTEKGQCPLECRQQLGTALAPLAINKVKGCGNVSRGGEKRRIRQEGGVPGKEENIEPVREAQVSEGEPLAWKGLTGSF